MDLCVYEKPRGQIVAGVSIKIEKLDEQTSSLHSSAFSSATLANMEPDISDMVMPMVCSDSAEICSIEMQPVESGPEQISQDNSTTGQFDRTHCSQSTETANFIDTRSRWSYDRPKSGKQVLNIKHKSSPRDEHIARKSGKLGSQEGKSIKLKGKRPEEQKLATGKVKQNNSLKKPQHEHINTADSESPGRESLANQDSQGSKITHDEKHFKCDICQKEFKLSGHLTRHKRVHTGERPFKCDICFKAFKDSSVLKRHRRIHQDSPDKRDMSRPYVCQICKKAFMQNKDLKYHNRIHTGVRPLYQCKTCNKAFLSSSYLTVHERIHRDERPYSCDICQLSFTSSNTLTRHYRTHTGEKPHKCNICGKAFTRPATLRNHQQQRHDSDQPLGNDADYTSSTGSESGNHQSISTNPRVLRPRHGHPQYNDCSQDSS